MLPVLLLKKMLVIAVQLLVIAVKNNMVIAVKQKNYLC